MEFIEGLSLRRQGVPILRFPCWETHTYKSAFIGRGRDAWAMGMKTTMLDGTFTYPMAVMLSPLPLPPPHILTGLCYQPWTPTVLVCFVLADMQIKA